MTEAKQKPLRAALYIRVSSKEQADMYWEDLQRESIMNHIKHYSEKIEFAWEQYVYIDSAVSGADEIDDRSALPQLFDDIENTSDKPFDVVMVYKIDRFARKIGILLEIAKRFEKDGIWFISVKEQIDTSNSYGKFMFHIMWVFAELEREMILERTSDGRNSSIQKGTWMNDKYWYIRDPITKRPSGIDEAEANVIKNIFDWYVYDWLTVTEICRRLSDLKISIPWVRQGKNPRWVKELYKWTDNTIRKILADEVYIWKLYYNKTKFVKSEHKSVTRTGKKKKGTQMALPKEERIPSEFTHTPIIDEATFLKAQKRLEKKGDYKNSNESYILSGLLKCDHCKEHRPRWMLQWKGKTDNGRPCYQCNGKDWRKHNPRCDVIPLAKNDLEDFIVNNLRALINKPELIEKFVKNSRFNENKKRRLEERLRELIDKRDKILSKREVLVDLVTEGLIDKDEFKKRLWKLSDETKEISTMNSEISRTEIEIKRQVDEKVYMKSFSILKEVGQNLDKIFNNKDDTKKLLHYIIDEIIVHSKPRDKDKSISWKKKDNQYIPYWIEVIFKLPQDFFNEMLKQDFSDDNNGSNYDNWSSNNLNIENDKTQDWNQKTNKTSLHSKINGLCAIQRANSFNESITRKLFSLPIRPTKIEIALGDFFC